jgi:hypothetical protein
MSPLHGGKIGFTLPTNNSATPIKKRCRIEFLATHLFHQTGNNVTPQFFRHISQDLITSPWEIFREASQIHIFTATLFQQRYGMAHIAGIIQFWIGFPLNEGNSHGVFHGTLYLSCSLHSASCQLS